MAKIIIEIDTRIPEDAALVVALGETINSLGLNTSYDDGRVRGVTAVHGAATGDALTRENIANAAEAIEQGPRDGAVTQGPQDEAPKRTRRTRAQIEADNAAQATAAASGSATNGAGPGHDAVQTVTLADVETLMREIMGKNAEAADAMIAAVRKATNGTSISPRHCDPAFLPAIHEAFAAMLEDRVPA